MPPVAKPKRTRQRTYLREWRKAKRLSGEKAAEAIGMSRENLQKIENGLVPYNQDVLEQLADLYKCEVGDLLMRDPSTTESIWSLWDVAAPAERAKIVNVVKAMVDSGSEEESNAASARQAQWLEKSLKQEFQQDQAQSQPAPAKRRPRKSA